MVLDDWATGLAGLTSNAASRRAKVERGEALVRSDWSVDKIAQQWLRALSRLNAPSWAEESSIAH
jgi:hypothetical protein